LTIFQFSHMGCCQTESHPNPSRECTTQTC
jgi:hypothetical protein